MVPVKLINLFNVLKNLQQPREIFYRYLNGDILVSLDYWIREKSGFKRDVLRNVNFHINYT